MIALLAELPETTSGDVEHFQGMLTSRNRWFPMLKFREGGSLKVIVALSFFDSAEQGRSCYVVPLARGYNHWLYVEKVPKRVVAKVAER